MSYKLPVTKVWLSELIWDKILTSCLSDLAQYINNLWCDIIKFSKKVFLYLLDQVLIMSIFLI